MWIKFLRWENFIPQKNHFVCSEHFERDQFDGVYETKKILKKDAVPTLLEKLPTIIPTQSNDEVISHANMVDIFSF